MSDLVSTPSQSQSTVSNEAFEALIDLLASDGIEEDTLAIPRNGTCSQPLRDPSGKLDFDKIRLMFAAQNHSHRVSLAPGPPGEQKECVQSLAAVSIEDVDSDDEAHSHRSTSPTVPSRSNCASSKSAERPAAGHRRSSTFGNQPWTMIPENTTAAKKDEVPVILRQPLSFDELNTALASAHEETRTLRRQYDDLRTLVSKRLGTEPRDQVKRTPSAMNIDEAEPDKDNGRAEARDVAFQASSGSAVVPLPSDVPTEVATLSENEAKRALSALAISLNLPLSTIRSMTSPSIPAISSQSLRGLSPNLTRQHDVASIIRAVKFLDTVDELVWRRATGPAGPRTLLPVFSEENIVSLIARLELWERAVRRPSKA